MGGWAAGERRTVVRLLRQLGPGAPVVPRGWTTSELAAHLYVRERRPDATPGVVLPAPFASYTDRVMASALRVQGYDDIVERVAAGPPLPLRLVDDAVNLHEFFVHAEDIRRVTAMAPRQLPDALQTALWNRVRMAARPALRRVRDVRVTLVDDGGRRTAAGNGAAVTVSGAPGELLLWLFDRRTVARVEVTGDSDGVRRLAQTRLG